MEYFYTGLALLGAILCFIHYKKSKYKYRLIKLSFAINLFLVFIVKSAVLMGYGITSQLGHAIFGLVLLSIVLGELVSLTKSGFNVIPTFGYELKVEKKSKGN
jgi:hypothetical protein